LVLGPLQMEIILWKRFCRNLAVFCQYYL